MRNVHWALFGILVVLSACKKDETAGGTSSAAPATAAKPPQCVADGNKQEVSGRLISCLLSEEWKPGRYTCKKGYMVGLHPNGSLKTCSFATPTDVDGFRCQEQTELYDNGKFKRCKLGAAKTVNGVDLRVGDWITVYKSGAVKRVELGLIPGKLKDYSCKGYMNYFHENGQLKKCELAASAKIDGAEVAGGTFVCFDDKGKRVSDCNALTFDMLD